MPHTSDHRPPTRHAASSSLLLPSSFFLPASFLPLRTTVPMLSNLSTLASTAKSIACNLSPAKKHKLPTQERKAGRSSARSGPPSGNRHAPITLLSTPTALVINLSTSIPPLQPRENQQPSRTPTPKSTSCPLTRQITSTPSRRPPSRPTSAGPPHPACTRVLCVGERTPHWSASAAQGPGQPDAPQSRSPARVLSRSGEGRRAPSTSPSGWRR